MRILRLGPALVLLLAVTACGSTDPGPTSPSTGSSDPVKLDRQQFESVRSALEDLAQRGFAAAGTGVSGDVKAGKVRLVPCELKGDGVGRLDLSGSLLYDGLDPTASAEAVRSALTKAGLEAEGDERSLSVARTVEQVKVSIGVEEPVDVQAGPRDTLRRLSGGTPCLDLGADLYAEMR